MTVVFLNTINELMRADSVPEYALRSSVFDLLRGSCRGRSSGGMYKEGTGSAFCIKHAEHPEGDDNPLLYR